MSDPVRRIGNAGWLLMLLLFSPLGCGDYPEVSSTTYEIAKALYTACNLQSEERLEAVADTVTESLQQERITDKEAGWLNDIVQNARDGNWDSAAQEAKRLLKDQTDG